MIDVLQFITAAAGEQREGADHEEAEDAREANAFPVLLPHGCCHGVPALIAIHVQGMCGGRLDHTLLISYGDDLGGWGYALSSVNLLERK